MKLETPEDLFHDQLKDMFSAESQLIKALPKLAKAAASPDLRKALSSHLKETRGQVRRLQQVGRKLGMPVTGKKCKGMEGLVKEGSEALKATGDECILDLALIAGGQRVEHYEISSYMSLIKLATDMGQSEAASLLEDNLHEEIAANKKLTALSEQLTEDNGREY